MLQEAEIIKGSSFTDLLKEIGLAFLSMLENILTLIFSLCMSIMVNFNKSKLRSGKLCCSMLDSIL